MHNGNQAPEHDWAAQGLLRAAPPSTPLRSRRSWLGVPLIVASAIFLAFCGINWNRYRSPDPKLDDLLRLLAHSAEPGEQMQGIVVGTDVALRIAELIGCMLESKDEKTRARAAGALRVLVREATRVLAEHGEASSTATQEKR